MGSFVETTLSSGENIKYEARISLWPMWPTIFLGILTSWFGLGLILLAYVFLKRWSTELAITDKKIVAKCGLISRQTVEILLPRVESIHVQQGFTGRLFNFGTVVMSGTGNAAAPIVGVKDPLLFRRVFLEIQESATK